MHDFYTRKKVSSLFSSFSHISSLVFIFLELMHAMVSRAPICQGYGLTETFAGATFSEWDDTFVGHAGPPLPCAYVKVC